MLENEPVIEALPAAVAVPPKTSPLEINWRNATAVRIGLLAAFIAMLLFAVLLVAFPISLPLLHFITAFLVAGFLSVLLYRGRTGESPSIGGGARLGWITGVFSFLLFMIQFTAAVVMASTQGGIVAQLRQQLPRGDARAEEAMRVLSDPSTLAIIILAIIILFFILFTLAGTLGGALGGTFTNRERHSA